MAKHAAAENLFDRIVSHDARKVEEFLALGDSILWRELIRYEFNIQSLENPELVGYPLLLKLIAYDIKTISPFHLAALMGTDDILVSLMEKDVPVDITILSGTTALHLASFAGKFDTVQLLVQVYKADIHAVDRYGWSALHYACAEGHLSIVRIFVNLGMDVNARDQDGTTPAFRAHVNGHKSVVKYLLDHGSDDDILNIEDVADAETEAERISALYSKVNKLKKKPGGSTDNIAANSLSASEANGGAPKPETTGMFNSAPALPDRRFSEGTESSAGSYMTGPKKSPSVLSRSKTLPSKYKNNPPPSAEKKERVRRLIRKELEISFGSDYETAVSVGGVTDSKATIWEEAELKDIGVKTLTGLMREEFEKFKTEGQVPMEQAPPAPKITHGDDPDYEDLYASLAGLPRAPQSPPPRPPLPPNHPSSLERRRSSHSDESFSVINPSGIINQAQDLALIADNLSISDGSLLLTSGHSINPALTQSFMRLSTLLGKDWKKLAHALPLADTPSNVDQRIKAIEKQAPKSLNDQALRSLTEWRVKKGREASVDGLIIALRKANLRSLIPDVEKSTQEFTA